MWSSSTAPIPGTGTGTVGSGLEMFGIPTGLVDLGAWGLLVTTVAFVFLSIFRGWIIVKLHYDALLKRCEVAEETIATLTSTNAVQAKTIEQQTVVGETVVRVMNSVQEARATSGDAT